MISNDSLFTELLRFPQSLLQPRLNRWRQRERDHPEAAEGSARIWQDHPQNHHDHLDTSAAAQFQTSETLCATFSQPTSREHLPKMRTFSFKSVWSNSLNQSAPMPRMASEQICPQNITPIRCHPVFFVTYRNVTFYFQSNWGIW